MFYNNSIKCILYESMAQGTALIRKVQSSNSKRHSYTCNAYSFPFRTLDGARTRYIKLLKKWFAQFSHCSVFMVGAVLRLEVLLEHRQPRTVVLLRNGS